MYPNRTIEDLHQPRRIVLRGIATLFVVCMLGCSTAYAWHATGHKATAAIAFEQLSAADQSAVIAILRQHPRFAEDFVAHMPADMSARSDAEMGSWLMQQASIWPDLIQTLDEEVRRKYNNSRWHYINLLVWLTPEDESALSHSLDHNMETQFNPPMRRNLNAVQALRGNLATWRDPGASDADKAVALCWILHLTGDLHQPLHTVALFSRAWFPEGDRGGNSIEVAWGDETRNLHAVWDGLPTHMEDLSPSEQTLRSIDDDVVDDAAIDEWLHHHANLARRFVYTDDLRSQLVAKLSAERPPLVTLSHEYLVAARSLARRQINLAGHRIARLLQD